MARSKSLSHSQLKNRYAETFMQALTYKTTARKNTDVLYHMLGFFKKLLSEMEKQKVIASIEDYRKEQVPLSVPIMLIKRHARTYKIDDLVNQVYLHGSASAKLALRRAAAR